MSTFKKSLQQKLLIKITELTNEAKIADVNDILEKTYSAAMEKDGFGFNHYEGFTESLSEIYHGKGKIFIAKYAGKIVGTLSLKLATFDRWFYRGEATTVCHVAVLPEYQKYGIGRLLVERAKQEGAQIGLPMLLETPEKNINAIRFYERNGFEKVRFYKANDHYTINFVLSQDNDNSKPMRSHYFENSALQALMKHFEMCKNQGDDDIQKKFDTDYLKYLVDASDDQREDMVKCFRRYGISPREYIAYGFEGKKAAQRRNYLSARTIARLRIELNNGAEEQKHDYHSPKPSIIKGATDFVDGYIPTLRIVTLKANGKVDVLFASINLNPVDKNNKKCFINVDVDSGELNQKVLISGKRLVNTALEHNYSEVPAWNDAVELSTKAGEECANVISGWDLIYTSSGWRIAKQFNNPSFVPVQQATKGAVRSRLEELLENEINTRAFPQ